MKCPKCGAKMGVIQSNEHGPQSVRRRRKCLNTACGHRLTSEEKPLVAVALTSEAQRAQSEKIMEMAAERRHRAAQVRRDIENRQLAQALGLDPEELNDAED